MKHTLGILLGGISIACSLGLSLFLFIQHSGTPATGQVDANSAGDSEVLRSLAEMQSSLNQMSRELSRVKKQLGSDTRAVESGNEEVEAEGEETGASGSVLRRIDSLESSLASLQANYNGISIDAASEERQKVFASAEGALKADEYFEAGKYSIAAEGYLTYYRNHPDEGDSRGVLERARRSYQRAGYSDMAIWVQEELMRLYPENRLNDLSTLAQMKKDAGFYDEAIDLASEAADMAPELQSRLWQRMYWAWYNQLRDGNEAGLEAYREVQQEIRSAEFPSDHKLNERVNEKIQEILRQMENRSVERKQKAGSKTAYLNVP